MRIAIIIPTLNEASGIVTTLESLQPLRSRGHVLIVADGGSDDATVECTQALADRVVNRDR